MAGPLESIDTEKELPLDVKMSKYLVPSSSCCCGGLSQ